MMSDVDLPAAHIRNQVAAAIDVIVHLARLRGGRRVVWEVASIDGTHRGEPVVTGLTTMSSNDDATYVTALDELQGLGVIQGWGRPEPTPRTGAYGRLLAEMAASLVSTKRCCWPSSRALERRSWLCKSPSPRKEQRGRLRTGASDLLVVRLRTNPRVEALGVRRPLRPRDGSGRVPGDCLASRGV